MSVTHVAGPVVTIGSRVIQRCAVCGEKLADNKNTAAPVNPDGSPPEFPTWPERSLVQIEAGNPTRYSLAGDFMQADKLPEDFCLALVE